MDGGIVVMFVDIKRTCLVFVNFELALSQNIELLPNPAALILCLCNLLLRD